MVRVDWLGVLGLMTDMFVVFTRRDCGWILAGAKPLPSRQNPYRLLYKLERDGLIQSSGQGHQKTFRVTPKGLQRLSGTNPSSAWERPWDGRWRIVSYDLPETRRRDRQLLWRALRAQRLGLLQRSVWIWPHELQPLLVNLVEAQGAPECFIGFESATLFLATHAEVVATAWDWKEIQRRQKTYLQRPNIGIADVLQASDCVGLARLARREREAFQFAFSLDPLLPAELLPEGYQGRLVVQRHDAFRQAWRRRWAKLTD